MNKSPKKPAIVLVFALIAVFAMALNSCSQNNEIPKDTVITLPETLPESTELSAESTENRTEEDTTSEAHAPAEREGWNLSSVPAFTGGKLDTKLYVAGRGLTTTSGKVMQQNLSAVSADSFSNYLNELELCGFVKEYENSIDGNQYVSYVKDKIRVYTYYVTNLKKVTVIKENITTGFNDFCYSNDTASSEKAVLYAYGFGGTGQLLLWHMSDGSWIINDGATDNIDVDALFAFMCKKSGIDPQGSDKLNVSLWYITHMHGDHAMGVVKLINKYHARISIERMMWNVPEQSVITSSSAKTAQAAIDKIIGSYYKDVKFLRPHTGMEVKIGDVLFRFLMTQEDNTDKFVSKEYTDFNSTSAVCMTEFAGIRMFLPGDMKNGSLDNFVCKAYKLDTYTSPVIQVAHHGYNSMKAWYSLTLPKTEYAIFENTQSEGLKQGSGMDVYNAVGAAKCFFTDKTWVVHSVDGKLVIEEDR